MQRPYYLQSASGRKAALRSRLMPDRGGFSLADGLVRIDRDFKCANCGQIVSTDPILSGVHNRNHCPYCLWSRHLDLFEAGDRLAACKAPMEPVGLTLKKTRKRYVREGQGELMLVHVCMGCEKISINRIAADDHPETISEVFARSLELDQPWKARIEESGVRLLGATDGPRVRAQLAGWEI